MPLLKVTSQLNRLLTWISSRLKAPLAQHNPYLKMKGFPVFLAELAHYSGYEQTKLGIKLLLLTGVRIRELCKAKPYQFDLKNAIWRILPDHVKQLQRRVRTVDKNTPPYLVQAGF